MKRVVGPKKESEKFRNKKNHCGSPLSGFGLPGFHPYPSPLGAAAGVQVLDFTLPQFLELVSLDTPFFFHHGLRMPEPC